MEEIKNMAYWKSKNTLPGINNENDKKSIGEKFKEKIMSSKLAKDIKKASSIVGADLLKLQGYKEGRPEGDVHPQQVHGYKSKLIPSTSPQHKYMYKKKK